MNSDKKKKPGRPKKPAATRDIKHLGIVDKPPKNNNTYISYLLHNNVTVFRNIFTLLSGIKVKKVVMRFEKEKVKFYWNYKDNKTIIYIEILAEKICEYYCKYENEIELSLSNITGAIKWLNQDFTDITFIRKENTKELHVESYNTSSSINSIDSFNGCVPDNIDWIHLANMVEKKEEYPLLMECESKLLKNIMSNIANNAKNFNIHKINEEKTPVCFKYHYKNGNDEKQFDISSGVQVKNCDKGSLISAYVSSSRLKIALNTIVSKKTRLYVDEQDATIIEFDIDNLDYVKGFIMVEVINNNIEF